MDYYKPTYTLITKVLDPRHIAILRDWLEFLSIPPTELIIYFPNRQDIYNEMSSFYAETQIPWKPCQAQEDEDLKNNETEILLRMINIANSQYILLCNLDTLPYRNGPYENFWLQEVFSRLQNDNQLVFFSNCGVTFQADELEPSGRYFRTQRFSNNFGLIKRKTWLSIINHRGIDQIPNEATRRFHSEWALEEDFRENNLFGLRRLDTVNWRVFHVQQWDDRLFKTRELFRKGVNITHYLNRVYEEVRHNYDFYYNYPNPSLLRQIRVWIGAKRRLFWKRIKNNFMEHKNDMAG